MKFDPENQLIVTKSTIEDFSHTITDLCDELMIPEVYKNSVWYIDPHDYDSIDLDKIMAQKKKETK